MKNLIKLFLLLIVLFVTILVVVKLSGLLTVDDIKQWLALAEAMSPLYLVAVVVLLLLIDLVVSIPTLIVCLLAGYFLGFGGGAIAAITGLSCAGLAGYGLSRKFGPALLQRVVRCDIQIAEMESLFHRHGFTMILISRAVPMVPEASACMSGIARMPFKRFALAWMLGSYPYALVITYAGSVSSLENPEPAIYSVIGMMLLLWGGITLFSRYHLSEKASSESKI